jgi:hypothetical protein
MTKFDDAILNVGLELAMEFGKDWLMPIQSRLSQRFEALSAGDLDRYDKHCRETMKLGHRLVTEVLGEVGVLHASAPQLFSERLRAQRPWVSPSNLGALYSQGCYYAMK